MDRPQPITDLYNLWDSKGMRAWQPFMEKYNCRIIAEIGVRSGENFEEMIKHSPKLAVAVDAWNDDELVSRNDIGFTQKKLDKMYKNFTKKMSHKSYVKTFREYSHTVAKRFDDDFFDLVYLDADHSYEGSMDDLHNWYPKVRSGGFLVGDDFCDCFFPDSGVRFGVVRALNEFALSHRLKYFLLPGYGWAIVK
jgi:hypothetical protein